MMLVCEIGMIPPPGVAMMAETFGQAWNAVNALDVSWGAGTVDNQSNDSITVQLKASVLPFAVPPLGALTVLSGSLHEYRWDGLRLRRRLLDSGDQAGFPLGWVHDVVGAHAGTTLSVHAYSPPLTAMSYYEVGERGTLRRTRTELTDEPEGQ